MPIPFLISVLTVDADGFPTSSEVPVTVTIASGNGTLAGTTTVNTRSGSAGFSNLIIQGSGAFTLRFSSPGLTSVDSNPISVTGSAISAIR
ncbi:MAG: hypothetical protein IPP90_14730 [Gemmatimonadaceae bacterium]|nr:hypothetical protein [Gemmatimonadaceae bacterium]